MSLLYVILLNVFFNAKIVTVSCTTCFVNLWKRHFLNSFIIITIIIIIPSDHEARSYLAIILPNDYQLCLMKCGLSKEI